MSQFAAGSEVWCPSEAEVFTPAVVEKAFNGGEIGLVKRVDDGSVVELTEKQTAALEIIDPEVLDGKLDDLIDLNVINEASILHTLRLRFENDVIYTACGADVLVSLNPFKSVPGTAAGLIDDYIKVKDVDRLDPSVYTLAKRAYEAVLQRQDQIVLVAGESGAGKTEATKLIVRYLSRASEAAGSAAQAIGGESAVPVHEQLLHSNPVLEAFGNAQTERNHNSSRFGKLFSIGFGISGKGAQVDTAKVTCYLLEKSRVVWQRNSERNYHVYYQLLAHLQSAPLQEDAPWANLQRVVQGDLSQAAEYPPLLLLESGLDELGSYEEDYEETLAALVALGISPAQLVEVWKILTAILCLGNVGFDPSHSYASPVFPPGCAWGMRECAELLGVDKDALQENLCSHMVVGSRVPYSAMEATETKNALCKRLHSHLFDWLVHEINISLGSQAHHSASDSMSDSTTGEPPAQPSAHRMVHLLDIFGFEVFEHNSFEQLCINYCNEKLQGFFTKQVIQQELDDCARQGVPMAQVVFPSNAAVLLLLESKPDGLMALLDDSCKNKSGSDSTFIHTAFSRHTATAPAHGAQLVLLHPDVHHGSGKGRSAPLDFRVRHYAGMVRYSAADFRRKNMDRIPPGLVEVFAKSTDRFVSHLIAEEEEDDCSNPKFKRSSTSHHRTQMSISSLFRQQLQQLMGTIEASQPYFIRCIKSNAGNRAGRFEGAKVQEQLSCTGLLGVCQIRQAGWPTRMGLGDFVQRYGVLKRGAHTLDAGVGAGVGAGELDTEFEELMGFLVGEGVVEEGEWAMGKDCLVFLKEAACRSLDGRVLKIRQAVKVAAEHAFAAVLAAGSVVGDAERSVFAAVAAQQQQEEEQKEKAEAEGGAEAVAQSSDGPILDAAAPSRGSKTVKGLLRQMEVVQLMHSVKQQKKPSIPPPPKKKASLKASTKKASLKASTKTHEIAASSLELKERMINHQRKVHKKRMQRASFASGKLRAKDRPSLTSIPSTEPTVDALAGDNFRDALKTKIVASSRGKRPHARPK